MASPEMAVAAEMSPEKTKMGSGRPPGLVRASAGAEFHDRRDEGDEVVRGRRQLRALTRACAGELRWSTCTCSAVPIKR